MHNNNLFYSDNKSILINRLYENLPKKPYCTNNFMGLHIREKKYAISHSHIQFNHPNFKKYIVIDADYPDAANAWRYDFAENIPVPNLIVTNPDNTHCHFYYELSAPVSFTEASSLKAQDFFNAVSNKLTEVLRGDTRYTGLIAKNPAHEKWIVEAPRKDPYTLHELVEHLELDPREYRNKNKVEAEDVLNNGRNDLLFNSVRLKAYVDIRAFRTKSYIEWQNHVESLIEAENNVLVTPLPYSEVKSISKSIAKYCWKKDAYCYQEFCDRQLQKAKKGGKAKADKYIELRKKAVKLFRCGNSKRAIGQLLEVSYRTVIRWLLKVSFKAAVMKLSDLKRSCDNAPNQILAAFVACLVITFINEYLINLNEDDVLTIEVTFNEKLLI